MRSCSPLEETLALTGSPDTDPVAKLLARERLAEILALAERLTALERGAITLSLNDHTRRESARTLGVGERAITNALQRGRRSSPRERARLQAERRRFGSCLPM